MRCTAGTPLPGRERRKGPADVERAGTTDNIFLIRYRSGDCIVMNRQLLVTVSEDKSALHGVRFLCNFFRDKAGVGVTLFYTAPKPQDNGAFKASGEDTDAEALLCQTKQCNERGEAAIAEARSVLLDNGFQPGQIESKCKIGIRSKVMDIIAEAEDGLYDAVILGRRGISWMEETLGESVTRTLLDESLDFPFWVCRTPDPQRRNVLLCVDGSPPSLRMADHVGFMLALQPEQTVTLFHSVTNAEAREDAITVLDRCQEMLAGHGVPKENVETRLVVGNNVSQSILSLAEKDQYAVVAMGRTGSGGGLLKRLFMGSARSILFRQLQGAALWVCH